MTTQIIPIFVGEISGAPIQLVDARLLHNFLEITTRFNDWIFKRIEEYCFVEGQDFYSKLSKSAVGRPSKEYDITLDMAKELAMVERNEKGRAARRYFIECEKMLRAGASVRPVQKPATFHDMVQSKYDLTVKPDGGPRQTVSEILKTCGIAHTNANMARLHSLLQNEGYVMGVYQGKRGYRMAQVDRGLPANTTPATFDQNHISFDEPGSYILDVQRYGVTVTHVPFGKRIMING